MHHRVSHIEDKGLFLVALVIQKIDGFISVEPGEAAHIAGVTRPIVIFVKGNSTSIVGSEGAKVIIKTLGIGHAFNNRFAVGDIPFTNTGSLITSFANQFRPRDFRSRHSPTTTANGLTPGEERRTRWTANGLGVERGKARTFIGQLIQARRPVFRVAVTAQIRIALIVGKNDEDVWPLSIGVDQSTRGEECKDTKDDKNPAFFYPDTFRI